MSNKEIVDGFNLDLVDEARRLRNRAKKRNIKNEGTRKLEWQQFKADNYKPKHQRR